MLVAASFIADEPTGNLDSRSERDSELFHDLCHDSEDPISILMVTHDPVLASKADRMLLLRDGITAASDIRSAWGDEIIDSISGDEGGRRMNDKTRFQRLKDGVLDLPSNADGSRILGEVGKEGLLLLQELLASLVITTVLAYGNGLSQTFLQFSIENDVYDAK